MALMSINLRLGGLAPHLRANELPIFPNGKMKEMISPSTRDIIVLVTYNITGLLVLTDSGFVLIRKNDATRPITAEMITVMIKPT